MVECKRRRDEGTSCQERSDAPEIEDIKPFRMHAGDREVYYTYHNCEIWDDVSHKQLDDKVAKSARLDEIKQL